jgi:hypothetical protein
MPAYFPRDMVGSSGSRPEIGARPDAPLAHLDHDGNLRADRTCGSTPSSGAAFGVRHKFTVHYGPIGHLFNAHRNGCNRRQVVGRIGGASRDRTDDLIVANDGVCQSRAFTCLHLAADHVPQRSNCRCARRRSFSKIQVCRESCLNSLSGLHPMVADAPSRARAVGMFTTN